MKNRKMTLPLIIIAVAVFGIILYSLIYSISFKPAVTEAEFPFTVTYELDGETVTINDVYKAHYVRNDGYANTKGRVYEGGIKGLGEIASTYTLKKGENTRVELWTQFYADYLMGDPEYDYFIYDAFEPKIYYYDANEVEYSDAETLAAQGVKLISFEYPTPIENSLKFSHLSYLSGAVVLPILLIAFLALLAIIIFVKKDKELKYKAVDIVSIVLNWINGTVYLGFVSILALLIDIEGGGPELYYQIIYFIPAVSLLCIAGSVALRRKRFRKSSLIVGLIGPIIFALYLLIFYFAESAF